VPAFVRAADALIAVVLLIVGFGSAAADEAPRRVVSMNLCTDQLALYLAAPGQLVSVSYLSHDEKASVMAADARRLPVNHGLAEEVFLLHPDLVLAGTFTSRASIEMLVRLGFRVERFEPESSLDDIRSNILRMGRLLGREAEARRLAASFDAEIASLRGKRGSRAPLGAAYYANGLTSGTGTLVNEIITTAGWRNLAAELGIEGMGLLPLELIVMNHPDALIGNNQKEEEPSLAFQNYSHPALIAALRSGTGVTPLPERYTVCGTPATAQVIRQLVDQRRQMTKSGGKS
jgi:iron complex transport system substrate-binding protein